VSGLVEVTPLFGNLDLGRWQWPSIAQTSIADATRALYDRCLVRGASDDRAVRLTCAIISRLPSERKE